ncbi:putative beta-glucosidase M [Cytospora mali]|uniref:beta-glucosidase n=1 Tax=Cytospora mali TaxID=578113 RepID=A0A194UMN4_CYTMA|nr:putative beta-glucosidase M [Valsa mali var. pyri (nom. inval.)]
MKLKTNMRYSFLLGALALGAPAVSADDSSYTAAELEAMEKHWSYGRSEPVYPTPEMLGTGEWADAYAKARDLVSQLTNEEKNNITYGYTSTENACSGNSFGVDRLNFTGLCLSDAAAGVRGTDMVNAYPHGVHVGASWNKTLTLERASCMGAEFKKKGVNVALGPVAGGPLGKIATGGRNFEGFSNDPYLSGVLSGLTVEGIQKHVISCVKHFIGYEQETRRFPYGNNVSISSNIDDRTMHELYMWPFYDAIKAGAGSVMASYNRVNNSYACQNSKSLNGLLKTDLGFQGFVVSDWYAQHSGIASAESGLDMVMPNSSYWNDGQLAQGVTNGSLAQSRLDDMATRILASYFRFADLEDPGSGIPASIVDSHHLTDARNTSSRETIFQGAVEGQVLVKNVNNALPLKNPNFLSLFGYDGVAQRHNTMDKGLDLSWWSFGLDNARQYLNGSETNATLLWDSFNSKIPYEWSHGPGIALNGTLFTGGGSGASTPSYIDAPLDAFQRQAREDGTFLAWDFDSQQPLVNQGSEACIVFINALSAEGWDRPFLADDYSDVLVETVASQCNNTMVVIHNAGVRLVDRWIDNVNITAVILAHVPGQDSGAALVEIMYGKQAPSGRLPYTVAKNESDYAKLGLLDPIIPVGDLDLFYPQDNFTEGVYIDYKGFIKADIEPRFAFGYGLTYTTFDYSLLESEITSDADTSYFPPGAGRNGTAVIVEGGIASLWDIIATVNCTVTNSGSVDAAEVAQLYIGVPGAGVDSPDRVLRGFDKQLIAAGESRQFTFELKRRDLSVWDVTTQAWVLQQGTYDILVGKNVLDIQLQGELRIGA